MSLKTMGRVKLYQGVRGAEKLVLIGIADVSDDAGVGWITVSALAEWASVDKRSVSRILARLVARGYIERHIGQGGYQDHRESLRPSLYKVMPEPVEIGVEQVAPPDPTVTPPPDPTVTPPPDPTVTPPPDPTVRSLYNVHSTSLQHPLTPKGGERGFEQVYAEYPRQTDEVKARAVWGRINPDEGLQQCMRQAIAAWRTTDEWQRESGRFVPKFWKWLLYARWRDVPGFASTPPKPQPAPAPHAPAAKPSPEQRAKIAELLGRKARTTTPQHQEAA